MLHVVLKKVVSESCLQPASCTWSRHSFVKFRQTQGPDGSHFIDFGISLIQRQCSIYSTQHSARRMSLMGRSVCKGSMHIQNLTYLLLYTSCKLHNKNVVAVEQQTIPSKSCMQTLACWLKPA